jgi:hypothetical protein
VAPRTRNACLRRVRANPVCRYRQRTRRTSACPNNQTSDHHLAPCYTSPMATKITLKEIGEMLTHVVKHMATKDDIADIPEKMATKDQALALQTKVNSIEQQLHETKTEVRLCKLEEKVFGAPHR